MTQTTKSQAMRLAIYLQSVQQIPNVSDESYRQCVSQLMRQYQNLPAEQRKEARRLGRILIRKFGLDAAVGDLVPVPAKVLKQEILFQKRREAAAQWSQEAPACTSCLVRSYGIPKKSFPSQEMAERVAASMGDPLLVAYRCPVQPGWFHLGHLKTRNNST